MAIKNLTTKGFYEPAAFLVTQGFGSFSSGEVSVDSEKIPANKVFGIGLMGKSRVHPHPLFSRHKQ